MTVDKGLEFCDGESCAATAGTAIVGDVIDLGASHLDGWGSSKDPELGPMDIILDITTAFASSGSATVGLKLMTHTTTTVTSGSVLATIVPDGTAIAGLTAGLRVPISLPVGKTAKRYIALVCVTAVATTTAGTVDCFAVPTGETSK